MKNEDEFQNFQIKHGVITSGKILVQEFRLFSTRMENNRLEGKAIWHEDIHDPGDYSIINVYLSLEGDMLTFSCFSEGGGEPGEMVFLRRIKP